MEHIPHPFGVLPNGNAPDIPKANPGLPFSVSLAQSTLLPFLSMEDLLRLSQVNSWWYVVVYTAVDLWAERAQKLASSSKKGIPFRSSWLVTARDLYQERTGNSRSADDSIPLVPSQARIYDDGLYFQWFYAAVCSPHLYLKTTENIVKRSREESLVHKPCGYGWTTLLTPVPRVRLHEPPSVFQSEFEAQGIPCVLEGVASSWDFGLQLNSDFTRLPLVLDHHYSSDLSSNPLVLQCEAFQMTPQQYVDYSTATETSLVDERPSYLFDAPIIHHSNVSVDLTHFRDDYFQWLSQERPDHVWLIAGPTRSGSNIHVDPNFTSAWNATLVGTKRWIFIKPGVNVPGALISEDLTTVATPVTLCEWLHHYYPQLVEMEGGDATNDLTDNQHTTATTVDSAPNTTQASLHSPPSARVFECVCGPGDVVFVPAGWSHAVINLEPTVAVTQNYVGRFNLKKVLQFLKWMPVEAISGVSEDRRAGLFSELIEAIQNRGDSTSRAILQQFEKEEQRRQQHLQERIQVKQNVREGLKGDKTGFKFFG